MSGFLIIYLVYHSKLEIKVLMIRFDTWTTIFPPRWLLASHIPPFSEGSVATA